MMRIENLPEMTHDQLLHQRNCIVRFGEKAQMDICIEEMSELTKALCKYKRVTGDSLPVKETEEEIVNNILKEIADVYITLTQMAMIFDKHDDLVNIMDQKIERNVKRMEQI